MIIMGRRPRHKVAAVEKAVTKCWMVPMVGEAVYKWMPLLDSGHLLSLLKHFLFQSSRGKPQLAFYFGGEASEYYKILKGTMVPKKCHVGTWQSNFYITPKLLGKSWHFLNKTLLIGISRSTKILICNKYFPVSKLAFLCWLLLSCLSNSSLCHLSSLLCTQWF